MSELGQIEEYHVKNVISNFWVRNCEFENNIPLSALRITGESSSLWVLEKDCVKLKTCDDETGLFLTALKLTPIQARLAGTVCWPNSTSLSKAELSLGVPLLKTTTDSPSLFEISSTSFWKVRLVTSFSCPLLAQSGLDLEINFYGNMD